MIMATAPAAAATIPVDSTAMTIDAGSCTDAANDIAVADQPGNDGETTLPEAICAAKGTAGTDVIELAATTETRNVVLDGSSYANEIGSNFFAHTTPTSHRRNGALAAIPPASRAYAVTATTNIHQESLDLPAWKSPLQVADGNCHRSQRMNTCR